MAAGESKGLANFTIEIDGKTKIKQRTGGDEVDLKDGSYVSEIIVEKMMGLPAKLEMHMNAEESKKLIFVDTIQEGKSIEIKVAWKQPATVTIFKGEIYGLELIVDSTGPDTLIVRAYDKSHRMTRGTQTQTFAAQTFSDIYKKVASDSGLTPDDPKAVSVKPMRDQNKGYYSIYNTNPHRFASAVGFLTSHSVDGGAGADGGAKVVFRKVDKSTTALKIDKEGKDPENVSFQKLRLLMNTSQQITEVNVLGWDPVKKAAVSSKKTAVSAAIGDKDQKAIYKAAFSGDNKYTLVNYPVYTTEEADEIAQSIYDRLALNFIEGEVQIIGNPSIELGSLIELTDFGDRFSGKYLVSGVEHIMSQTEGQGYKTIIHFRGNAIKK
jgi:phage protein D